MGSLSNKIFIIAMLALIVSIIGVIAFTLNDVGYSLEQIVTGFVFMGILVLALLYFVFFKKYKKNDKSNLIRRGWTPDEKEQVRIRQDGKCAHCRKPPPRWEYHHVNGDRSDNRLSNCEGLCPNCHSVETHEG